MDEIVRRCLLLLRRFLPHSVKRAILRLLQQSQLPPTPGDQVERTDALLRLLEQGFERANAELRTRLEAVEGTLLSPEERLAYLEPWRRNTDCAQLISDLAERPLLELGCGEGNLLQQLGSQAWGYEPCAGPAQRATERGLRVTTGSLEAALGALSSLSIEVVLACHFLERLELREVRSVLEQVARFLPSQGLLLVAIAEETPLPVGQLSFLLTQLGFDPVDSQTHGSVRWLRAHRR